MHKISIMTTYTYIAGHIFNRICIHLYLYNKKSFLKPTFFMEICILNNSIISDSSNIRE